MLSSRSLLTLVCASVFALLLVGCSGDDDDKSKQTKEKATPEFVRDTISAPAMGSAPPPIIISSGPGTGGLSIGPLPPGAVNSTTAGVATNGLTVRHVETATVPADRAFVVVQLQSVPAGPGPFTPSISLRQQEQVTAGLTAIGVKKEDISFESTASYGPFPSISVAVPVSELATRGRQIADAIESAVGTRPQSGARFALSDCRTALDPLRKRAIDAANEEAKALASVSSLTLGSLRSISQTLNPSTYGGPASDPCSGGAAGPRPPGNFLALDSEPKVTLNLQIEATYDIGKGDVEGGLSVTGSGKATAKADEAYIVVTVYNSSSGPFGPPPVSKKSRDELLARLKALKIDEDDIEIEAGFSGPSQTIVSVEAPIADVARTGKDVVAAVEDILGRSQTQGVWFTHSNCQSVLAEARKHAIADARQSAEALAASASLKLGSLTSISSTGAPAGVAVSPYATSATTDPCTDNVASLFLTGSSPYGNAGLKPLDAAPEFTVSSNIAVTYAIQP